MSQDLQEIARTLVTSGKGILAADEAVASTPQSRCAYREMLFTTPGIAEFISGVIIQGRYRCPQKRSPKGSTVQIAANYSTTETIDQSAPRKRCSALRSRDRSRRR